MRTSTVLETVALHSSTGEVVRVKGRFRLRDPDRVAASPSPGRKSRGAGGDHVTACRPRGSDPFQSLLLEEPEELETGTSVFFESPHGMNIGAPKSKRRRWMNLYDPRALGRQALQTPGHAHPPEGQIRHSRQGRRHDRARRQPRADSPHPEFTIPLTVAPLRIVAEGPIEADSHFGPSREGGDQAYEAHIVRSHFGACVNEPCAVFPEPGDAGSRGIGRAGKIHADEDSQEALSKASVGRASRLETSLLDHPRPLQPRNTFSL